MHPSASWTQAPGVVQQHPCQCKHVQCLRHPAQPPSNQPGTTQRQQLATSCNVCSLTIPGYSPSISQGSPCLVGQVSAGCNWLTHSCKLEATPTSNDASTAPSAGVENPMWSTQTNTQLVCSRWMSSSGNCCTNTTPKRQVLHFSRSHRTPHAARGGLR